MQITRIEQQKRHKARYAIYVAGEYKLSVHESTLVHFTLHKGMVVDDALLAQIDAHDQQASLYLKAVNYLSYAQRSTKEVRDYLMQAQLKATTFETAEEKAVFMAAQEPVIAAVIQSLVSQQYLDDLVYAESYVRTGARVGHRGPQAIKQKLQQRGVHASIIEQALLQYDHVWRQENMQVLADKYCKAQTQVPPKRLQRKLYQHLVTKGYNQAEVTAFISTQAVELNEDERLAQIAKVGEKLYRTVSRKYEGATVWLKLKEGLYRKGFDYDIIQTWVAQQQAIIEET